MQKMLCDFKQNVSPKIQKKSMITIAWTVRGGQDPGRRFLPNCSLAGILERIFWTKMIINDSRKKCCVISNKTRHPKFKKINDHHRVNGSWGPGPRSPISAKLQSGGHFEEGFLGKNDYQ
jgi:hypothetical protein